MSELIDRFITVQEAAGAVSCTPSHIYTMISSGELRAIRLGSRALRVSVQSINEYVERSWATPEDVEPMLERPRREKPPRVATSRWMSR